MHIRKQFHIFPLKKITVVNDSIQYTLFYILLFPLTIPGDHSISVHKELSLCKNCCMVVTKGEGRGQGRGKGRRGQLNHCGIHLI